LLNSTLIDMLLDIFLNFAEFVKTYVAALKETIANIQAQLESANAGEFLTRIANLEAELAATKQQLADSLANDAADQEAIIAAQTEADTQKAKADTAQAEAEAAKLEATRLADELAAAIATQKEQEEQLMSKINELRVELDPSA
jgi:chromosome segregation ATPase